jgi:hypothetical protein
VHRTDLSNDPKQVSVRNGEPCVTRRRPHMKICRVDVRDDSSNCVIGSEARPSNPRRSLAGSWRLKLFAEDHIYNFAMFRSAFQVVITEWKIRAFVVMKQR